MGFRVQDYENWMAQAQHTTKAANDDLRAHKYGWACFKAQQAAEYALKALARGIGIAIIGHSLLMLLRELQKNKLELNTLKDACMALERYYIATRYADSTPSPPFMIYNKKDASDAIILAQKIIEAVVKEANKIRKNEV